MSDTINFIDFEKQTEIKNQNLNHIIRISGLEKTYTGTGEKLTVLKNLDCNIPYGAKAVITGESGCGKSTFLNILSGIDSVTAGIVNIGPYCITSLDEDSLAEYRSSFLGMIFQFHYLLKDFTALENVFMPAYMAGLSKKEAEERARRLLNDVGLSNRETHLPSELSGGERQRVAVARALVNDPELLLADEPTGNLDPANAAVIGELLFSMTEQYKKTLVLVTHDLNLASMGNIHYTIKDGTLVRLTGSGGQEIRSE
ncbi:ABC transporter ATP-binding protein [Treponema parvum]|uniref:ABC transporter ATP-binding protein n=1 Tax=Treponema parvum TaxID=138851 RepID=A0A975F3M7_9SPIR|nr:ABC transporter ATP-binding protein [Treponema parvum]QTQ13765.1 ABC transporter ATP-binding protein [Treponema parvum]